MNIMENVVEKKRNFPFSTIFYYPLLDFHVNTGTAFSLRDKRLFEISEVEITRIDCDRSALVVFGSGCHQI